MGSRSAERFLTEWGTLGPESVFLSQSLSDSPKGNSETNTSQLQGEMAPTAKNAGCSDTVISKYWNHRQTKVQTNETPEELDLWVRGWDDTRVLQKRMIWVAKDYKRAWKNQKIINRQNSVRNDCVRVRGRSEGCGVALSCGKNTSKQLDLLRRMYGNKCWQECRKRETVSTVGRMYVGAATKENCMEVPQKILELPHDPAIPFLGIFPKRIKTLIWRDICTPMFIAGLSAIAMIWKQSKCPTDG